MDMGGRNHHHFRPCRLAGENAGRGVFEYKTVACVDAQLPGRKNIAIRVRLSGGDIAIANQRLGLEAGALFPGSALRDATGRNMDEVFGGRAMIDYRL